MQSPRFWGKFLILKTAAAVLKLWALL